MEVPSLPPPSYSSPLALSTSTSTSGGSGSSLGSGTGGLDTPTTPDHGTTA